MQVEVVFWYHCMCMFVLCRSLCFDYFERNMSLIWSLLPEVARVSVTVEKHKVEAGFHMLVYICDFTWGFAGDEKTYHLKCLSPPVPMTGTGAQLMWQALEGHPWLASIRRFRKQLLNIADSAIELYCEDSASSNKKLQAYEDMVAPESWGRAGLPCMNHQNFIGQSTTQTVVFGPKLLLDMFCGAKFVNAGSHLLRSCCYLLDVGPISLFSSVF